MRVGGKVEVGSPNNRPRKLPAPQIDLDTISDIRSLMQPMVKFPRALELSSDQETCIDGREIGQYYVGKVYTTLRENQSYGGGYDL